MTLMNLQPGKRIKNSLSPIKLIWQRPVTQQQNQLGDFSKKEIIPYFPLLPLFSACVEGEEIYERNTIWFFSNINNVAIARW
ncbi:hypothetical protein IJ00_21770 [Calothrix sp. 336/3]|nr:hypothetical protein IJ00_21770 [Calothrix sp. 336/3]